jgi:hypothetical protein
LTTGGTVGADGRTGELAHKAAEVSCVTNLALENESSFRPSPEDVRNTFFNFDFSPGKTVLVRSNTVLGKIAKHIRESDKAMPDTTKLNHCYKAKTVTVNTPNLLFANTKICNFIFPCCVRMFMFEQRSSSDWTILKTKTIVVFCMVALRVCLSAEFSFAYDNFWKIVSILIFLSKCLSQ